MTVNKPFYNFEKIEERGQKKFKKIIAHNGHGLLPFASNGIQPDVMLSFVFETFGGLFVV